MTYSVKDYEFTAFKESDFNSGNISKGDTFTMPASATTCITVTDNDAFLSGDSWCNENSNDRSYQQASIDVNGQEAGNGGQIYAEKYFTVKDQNGNSYIMVEIEQEGSCDDYFTFYNGGPSYLGTPPDGAELTVVGGCNVTSNYWLDFKCLDAGPKEEPNGWIKGRLTFDEDCNNNEWNEITCTWDSGVAGKVVQLLDLDGNVVATTTTSANGSYQFDVPAGDYRVQFPELEGFKFSEKDSGVAEHYDSDANANGLTDVISLSSGQVIKNVDAGIKEIPLGSISGKAFCDVDCDGIHDSNVAGNTFVMEAEDMYKWNFKTVSGDQASEGELVKLKAAGAGGDLWQNFGGESGTYNLTVFVQDENDGQSEIIVKVGGVEVGRIDLDNDSDGRGSNNGGFSEITLEGIDIDAGEEVQLWVGGDGYEYVRIDKIEFTDVTTVVDEEPVKEGIEVNLIDANGDVVATTTTDAEGNYTFDDIPDGDYTVNFAGVEGEVFTLQDQGDDDSIDSDVDENGNTGVITIAGGNNVTDVDAGYKEPETGSISGRVFCDLDCDGLEDATDASTTKGENLIINGDFENNPLNNTGWGLFDSIEGWVAVKDKIEVQESNYGTGNTEGNAVVELDANENAIICQDVSIAEAGTYCFSLDYAMRGNNADTNGFAVFVDGVKQAEVFPTESGFMALEFNVDLEAGNSRIDIKGLGASDCIGTVIDNVELRQLIEIPATVEPGKDGVEVNLLDSDGNVVATTTTDADGNYTFGDLVDGDYTVQVAEIAGQQFTLQNVGDDDTIDSDVDADGLSGVISILNGNDVTDVDAGLKEEKPGSLSGTYFCDDDRDGVDDGAANGDKDIAGKMVTLLNADGTPAIDFDGNPVAPVMTDAEGNYSFGNLQAGDYKVQFESSDADGKSFIAQDVGNDDAIDSDVDANGMTGTVTVNAGEETTDVDAGVENIPGSISGTYFCDDNRNGADDEAANGDKDVAGKMVTLLNADGTPATDINGVLVAAVLTDAEGNYSFGNLLAGDYKVQFESSVADGKSFIAQDAGNDDTDDSDVDANGMTGTVSVVAGQDTGDVDAGVENIPGSISGTYFCDDNRNGADDGAANGDVDIAGKMVTLLNADGTPAIDIDGNPVTPVMTDAQGNYSFDNLLAGDYKVQFESSDADGKSFIAQDAGNDDTDDSDVDANGMTGTVSVVAGQNTGDVDAGVENIPGSISGTYFCDENKDGADNGAANGDADVAGKLVTLLNANGTPAVNINGVLVAAVLTDAEGNYSFDNLLAGDYKVQFESSTAEGKSFIAQDAGNDDTDDSDVDANGTTGTVTVVAGQNTGDVDAGVEDINDAPEPMDDAKETCFFEPVSIDVTANDIDPDGDALTVTAINGIAIAEGDAAIDIDGVLVTLVNGELVFDGNVHSDLLANETAVTNYTYTVSDGNGLDADANVEVTFKGATDTLDKVADLLPTTAQFQLIDENNPTPTSDEAWTMQVIDPSGAIDGVYEFAYCLSAFDDALAGLAGTDINDAPIIDANVFIADDDYLPASIDFGGTGANGMDASENLDLINWIINQDFTSQDNGDGNAQNYTDAEIQGAIWRLTDGINFVADGGGTISNLVEIYNEAVANGEGFEANAANGDIVTVYFDPTGDNDPTNDHNQAFIIGVDLFEDCIC